MIVFLVLVVFMANPTQEHIDHQVAIIEAPAGTAEQACLVQGKLITDQLMADPAVRDVQFACFSADTSRQKS